MTNKIKERYEAMKPLMDSVPENGTALAIRQNRRSGTPTQFEKAAVPFGDLHFLDLSKKRMPNGEMGLLARLSNAKAPTEKFPDTVLVGGQGRNQAVTKWLNMEPTEDGRGAAFAWDDELLPVFLDLLESLTNYEPATAKLPRVLGTKPSVTVAEALQAAATVPLEFNVFQTPCSGEVTYITEPEQGLPGYIRIVQKTESLQPLSQESVYEDAADSSEGVPQDFQPIVAEDSISAIDEVPILPGTKVVVKVGQQVSLGDALMTLDSEVVMSNLTESERADLAACCSMAAPVLSATELVQEAAMFVGKMPLYHSDSVVPRGDLYFDIVDLVDVDGSPVIQVVKAGNGIFANTHIRVDLRPSAVNWPRQRDFVPATPRDRQRAEARQRTRKLRDLGEKGALALLVGEAQALPTKEYDLKLDHIGSGPFPLDAVTSEKLGRFKLHVRHGDHARLAPAEKATMINEFLEELINEEKPSTGEPSQLVI
jgi:hypothetical protein